MSNAIFTIVTELERKLPFYLTGVGCHYRQEHVRRPEGYPAFQWIQCREGSGNLILQGEKFIIQPRQGMFLHPNVPHEYYGATEPWEVDWIGFNGFQMENVAATLRLDESGVFYIVNSETILAKMSRVLNIAQSDHRFKGLECSGLIYEILLDIFKYASKSGDDSLDQQRFRLQPVFDFIERNYPEIIGLETLADTIQVTPQHLCFLFKTILKLRPFEYLNQIRINKSKDLMIGNRSLRMYAIARAVGFDSASYFCAVFKKVEGISPGEFRRLHGI